MQFKEIILLVVSVFFAVSGQFLLKTGALKLGQVSSGNVFSHVLNIMLTPDLVLGLCCYACGALTYILLLTSVELSVAGPAIALSYVFSVLLGLWVFHEPVPLSRWAGLSLIVCGVLLVLWQK